MAIAKLRPASPMPVALLSGETNRPKAERVPMTSAISAVAASTQRNAVPLTAAPRARTTRPGNAQTAKLDGDDRPYALPG